MLDEVRMLSLTFKYYNEIEVSKARELLITSVIEFASAVNADARIRPYLKNYPFGPQNIEIRILIQKPDGKEPESGKLCMATAIKGELTYMTHDLKLAV